MAKSDPDLSVTALYTAEAWRWAGFAGAELLSSKESEQVFGATNLALGVARPFMSSQPSLKHGLAQRHAMIDHLVRTSGATQVLELAAGLSCRGVAFSADSSIRYTEVDLPHVVAKKRQLLERTEEGRAVLSRPNLRLVEGDVLEAPLEGLIDPSAPLFVIAEGLLMYLTPDRQRALFARVKHLFGATGGPFVFDFVPPEEKPKPGAAGAALGFLMKRFTKGGSFAEEARSRTAVLEDLRSAGFADARALEPRDVADAWSLPFRDVHTQQLVFVAQAR